MGCRIQLEQDLLLKRRCGRLHGFGDLQKGLPAPLVAVQATLFDQALDRAVAVGRRNAGKPGMEHGPHGGLVDSTPATACQRDDRRL